MSLLFIGLGVVYFVAIFFYRNRLSANAAKVMQRKRELSPMISEFIFYDEDSSKEETSNYINLKIEIRQLIKDDFNREILSEVLLDLRKDVSGDTQKRLLKLYQDLDLHIYAFAKLKSMRWEVVSNAIKDLTQMQVTEAYVLITKFINDKRATIRKQAEIAVVTLKYEGLNYFLDSTKHKISEWQQLKLLDVIRNREDYQPPRFKAWLTSNNSFVVLFALRLIKFYNQNDANASLIELIKHKNNQIKEEAIGCIKEFHVLEALETLKTVFWKSSTDLKIAILDAIGSLGTEKDIEFLQLIDKKESNFYVKSKALSSINAIDPERIMPSVGILDTSNYKIPDDITITEKTITADEDIDDNTESFEQDHQTTAEEIIKVENDLSEKEKNLEDEPIIPLTDEIIPNTIGLDFLPLVVNELSNEKEHLDNNIAINSINNLSVIFEEIAPIDTSNKTNSSVKEPYIYTKNEPQTNFTMKDLAFLPIVVETVHQKPLEMLKSEKKPKPIDEILVQFEIVASEEEQKDLTNLESTSISYDQYKTPDVFNIKVEAEELTIIVTNESSINNIEVIEPNFLSFSVSELEDNLMDEISNDSPENSTLHEEMSPEDEEKFREIMNKFIDFENEEEETEIIEEFQNSSLLDFENEMIDINFIPLIDNSEETIESTDDKLKNEKSENDKKEQSSEITANEAKIPNSILSDESISIYEIAEVNSEESMMQLLDDISEMGDSREVLLLNEMLVSEKYVTVKERVKKLIHRFTEDDVEKTTKLHKEAISLRAFNVFEDLFRTSDTEAKLILLDEIVHVGDEDDFEFLENLLTDKDEEIQRKAAEVLEGLRIKFDELIVSTILKPSESNLSDTSKEKEQILKIDKDASTKYASLMEELEINPSTNSFDIFDLSFEITADDSDDNMQEEHLNTKSMQRSFIGQLCHLTGKIMEKLNG